VRVSNGGGDKRKGEKINVGQRTTRKIRITTMKSAEQRKTEQGIMKKPRLGTPQPALLLNSKGKEKRGKTRKDPRSQKEGRRPTM